MFHKTCSACLNQISGLYALVELKLTGLQAFGISSEWQPLMSFSLILLDMNVLAADLQRDVNHTTKLLFQTG